MTTIFDNDGNSYSTVIIGNQEWTVENWKSTTLNDGTPIANLTANSDWSATTNPAYCYYDNLSANNEIFGKLYNFYAISGVNGKSLAPNGWRVPSDGDFTKLENYLIANGYNWDGTTTVDKTAKSLASNSIWDYCSTQGSVGKDLTLNNRTGFNGVPASYRNELGVFGASFATAIYQANFLGSTTENTISTYKLKWLQICSSGFNSQNFGKQAGSSVRMVRDLYYVDIDNNYTTSGNGTTSLPFTINNMYTYLNDYAVTNDVMKIKGYYKNTGTLALYLSYKAIININFESWDIDRFGLYGFDVDTLDISNSHYNSKINFMDAIFSNLKVDTYSPYNFKNNIFFDSISYVGFNINKFDNCSFVNCNISIDDYDIPEDYYGTFIFNDCIFYNSKIVNGPNEEDKILNLTFNNCVFSGTSAYNFDDVVTSGIYREINNCTFSWVSPTVFPDMSALSFKPNTTWNPNKGNLTFENYSIDYSFRERKDTWVSSASSTLGLYNSNKRGPGAFYFPSNTVYVDLDSTNVDGNGSSTNPLSKVTLSAISKLYDDDNIKLKGTAVLTDSIDLSGLSNLKFDAWDNTTNGPWKIIFTGSSTNKEFGFINGNNLSFRNGMIILNDSETTNKLSIPSVLMENLYVVVSGDGSTAPTLNTSASYLSIKGSNIILTSGSHWELYPTSISYSGSCLDIRDSILDIDSFSANRVTELGFINIDNCVTRSTDISALSGSYTLSANSNIQYGWNRIDWPDFTNNDNKDTYGFNYLNNGIHSITLSGSGNW